MATGLLTGLATIAQGEKQIAIDANKSAIYVASGTLVLIAGEAVEAVSGTANTITLKNNWQGDSQTNTRFIVINTNEGVRDVIKTGKEISDNLLSLLNNQNLLLSGDTPTVSVDVNGTPTNFVPLTYLTNEVSQLTDGANSALETFDSLDEEVNVLTGSVNSLQLVTTTIDGTLQGYVDTVSIDAVKAKEYAVQPYSVAITNTSDHSSLHHATDARNDRVITQQAKLDTSNLKTEVESLKTSTGTIYQDAFKLSTFGKDQEISPGVLSLKHYSIVTQEAAALAQSIVASVTASLYFVGSWNASNNTAPPAPLPNAGTPMYKISVKGVIDGVSYDPNDNILWDGENSIHDGSNWTLEKWSKIDNTENVTSVNGKSGAVMVSIADITGLDSSLNTLESTIDTKVATDIFNAKMAELDAAILANTLNTTIKMWGFTI